jgi:hypothetical protein
MARLHAPSTAAVIALQKRFGWRKAVWLLDFFAAWAMAVRANDWQPIDAEGYARYWKLSNAKGYGDQAKWRDMFEDEPTPNARVLAARVEYERRLAEEGIEPGSRRERDALAAIIATMPLPG